MTPDCRTGIGDVATGREADRRGEICRVLIEESRPTRTEVSLEQYIATTQMQIARDSQMQAHRDGLGCCPNCKRVVSRSEGCQNVFCGRANDPYGQNAAAPLYAVYKDVQSGNLGCGTTTFDITANRVPAPAPNGDVLDFFKPTRVAIPAHLLGMANLQLSVLPAVSVTFRLDCVPIAAQLLTLGVSGRPKLVLGDRSCDRCSSFHRCPRTMQRCLKK
jgi:hypothetical protein